MTRGLRIFLDANILFSAAKSDGAVRSLVARLRDAGHACCADGYVIEEARRNLVAKAPAHLPALDELVAWLMVSALAPAIDRVHGDGLHAKDRLVVAAAVVAACDILVTGDRTHFGRFYGQLIAGIRIHSPRSLHERLFPNG